MCSVLFSVIIFLLGLEKISSKFQQYSPDWNSLDRRPLPEWYDNAKFGIFMHWGVYSVPSYGAAEWFCYTDFAPMFTCEFFDPEQFVKLIKISGAKYFVLTSKHHEGYTMWPSKYSWNWNSMDVGPKRDIVGELAKHAKKAGIDFGLYYSLYEWFNPLYQSDKAKNFKTQDYVNSVVIPQLMEIIYKYQPKVLWSDGDWEAADVYWNSTKFLAWLYNESPVKEVVVVNDRWGKGTMCKHGDFYTCGDRFQPTTLQKHKWESCITIDRESWGFRREATLKDYHTVEELIEILIRTVSFGGNLLLNVGPTHYGKITPIFEERLRQIGQWLAINGEAVYSTKPWSYQQEPKLNFVWYTSRVNDETNSIFSMLFQRTKSTTVYAILLKWPDNSLLSLETIEANKLTKISMLGFPEYLSFRFKNPSGIEIDLSNLNPINLASKWAWVIKIENIASAL
ncbi:Alpha-L-fucosidase [Trichinella papuae]|uniref:Putative alpha-L-fucosidase n=1 Tax=Trichinella papuae TaxID=268474 RepID=A0A0V1N0C0_9BILA|nr:Alpha-L-fucosidase [Trichinella papuae]